MLLFEAKLFVFLYSLTMKGIWNSAGNVKPLMVLSTV